MFVRLRLAVACLLTAATAFAQELPPSGSYGLTFVYATSPGGQSQLYLLKPNQSAVPQPWGASVASVPSRWSHRRRTLGGLETAIAWDSPKVWLTPMGSAAGNGAIHLVDARGAPTPASLLVPTGNPAAYDLALVESLQYVFSAEDTGAGTTRLRGFSYGNPGTLTPLSPAFLDLPGAPSAYVNRMGLDESGLTLHVPTASGVHVVTLSASAPEMAAASFISSAPSSPATNPVRFSRNGVETWIVGLGDFSAGFGLEPLTAGFLSWTAAGASETAGFGLVPSVPTKNWVPAVGAEELAVVSNGVDTYVYSLLREPKPNVFFVKGSAVGVVRFIGSSPATVTTLPCSDAAGEPFSIPTAHGTRVAFETSFGPPFIFEPSDGGERICIIYSPLDPLGASTPAGLLVVPAPLNGRISTKGMERPLWSRDGRRVFATTSWFPGAPQIGLAGLEVLDVPAGIPLNSFVGPHVVVPTPDSPDQSIVFGTVFEPSSPFVANLFGGASLAGHVAHDGMASALAVVNFGEVGQKQVESPKFTLASGLPGFRSILPASFDDVNGSLVGVPPSFGARRATYDYLQNYGLFGLVMYAADDDRILLQPTGWATLAALGLAPAVGRFQMPLPTGWITTSEFLSL